MIKEEAYNFLKDINICVLSTVNAEGNPYSITMYYIVDEDLNFYFITETGTKKYSHMQKNPNVAVVVTNRRAVQTLQINGIAQTLQDGEKITSVVNQMSLANVSKKWLHWPPPISKVQSGQVVIVKVSPTWARFADYEKDGGDDIFSELAL